MKPFNKEQNYGWVEPKVEKEDYLFGSGKVDLSKPIRPDGQWNKLPSGEIQDDPFETSNCTAFGGTNQGEIYLLEIEGVKYNFSDRALGIRAGTYPPGNDPQKVYEKIRKKGLSSDSLLPFGGKNVDEYYDKSNITPEVEQSEKDFFNKYDFKHDWVSSGKLASPRTIKFALKYSPLGVAIYAFAFDGEYYIRAGKDGDWVVLVGYKEPTKDGKGYWIAYTSYAETNEEIIQQNMKEFNLPREQVLTLKKLDYDFGFYYVKRIHISKAVKKTSFLTTLLDYLRDIWR